MFDLSFSELLVIGFVALVVIGPEKLPKVARTAGAFFGRMQRFVAQVKNEVNRETRFEELQTLQDEVKSSLQHVHDEVEQSILPVISTEVEVTEVGQAEIVKKARKPRQSKTKANAEAVEMSQVVDTSAPQAELFAEPEVKASKPRRTRKASANNETGLTSPEPKVPT